MSRIGRRPVPIPDGVTVSLGETGVTVAVARRVAKELQPRVDAPIAVEVLAEEAVSSASVPFHPFRAAVAVEIEGAYQGGIEPTIVNAV